MSDAMFEAYRTQEESREAELRVRVAYTIIMHHLDPQRAQTKPSWVWAGLEDFRAVFPGYPDETQSHAGSMEIRSACLEAKHAEKACEIMGLKYPMDLIRMRNGDERTWAKLLIQLTRHDVFREVSESFWHSSPFANRVVIIGSHGPIRTDKQEAPELRLSPNSAVGYLQRLAAKSGKVFSFPKDVSSCLLGCQWEIFYLLALPKI